jgi:hypothetical protein
MMAKHLATLRLLAGCILPHTIVEAIRAQRRRKRLALEGERTRAIREALTSQSAREATPYSRSDVVDFLAALNCDRANVTDLSMQEDSLAYCCRELETRIAARPVLGLHIGNFVGVSLVHFTDFVRRLDERSTIVSIDLNLAPCGIHNPLEKVVRCLNRYNLQGNSLILTGYSLEKSCNNSGSPEETFNQEFSCENQLPQLARLMPGSFDFAVIDGCHDEGYLAREVAAIERLLKPAGLVIFDDVDWDGIAGVYRALDSRCYERIATNGRVGIARKEARMTLHDHGTVASVAAGVAAR